MHTQYNKNQEHLKKCHQLKPNLCKSSSCKPPPCKPSLCKPPPCKPPPCKPSPCIPSQCKPIETVTHDYKIILGECKVKRNVTYTHCIIANVEHTINENIICNHKPTTQYKVTNEKTYLNGKNCTAKPFRPIAPKPNDDMSSLYSCTTSRKKCKKIGSSSSDTNKKKSHCKKYPVHSSDDNSDECSL